MVLFLLAWVSLTNLRTLFLSNNQLSGCFPASLSSLCGGGRSINFLNNPGLPGNGDFAAFCANGAGSDAFTAGATASPTTLNVGQTSSLTATGGSSYAWQAPEGLTLSSTTGSVISATATSPGVKTLTVIVSNGGSCTAAATVSLTVGEAVSGPFSLTGVTTLSCSPNPPNRFSVGFNPRYQGLDGSPVSFSVVSELLPTTQPGPYTLQLYTDNPVITLEARQNGVTTRFAYNWLEACRTTTGPNTPPRVVTGIPAQTATVGQFMSYVIPEGTFTDDQTPTSLRLSAAGVPAGLSFSGATLSGTPSSTVGSPFSITITATDQGELSVSTPLVLSVQPANGTPPDPTAPFAITGVTTISCTPAGDRISLSFAPRYGGMSGASIAFEVVNESLPTTEPAPYSLTLYRDNPVITLRASQTGSGGPVTFAYNWLAACTGAGQDNTPPRVNEPVGAQSATVGVGYSLNLGNVFLDQETPDQVSLMAAGLPSGLSLSGQFISGTPSMSGVSSVTLTATDGGGLSSSTSFTLTVSPGGTTPPPNPPAGPFSLTGVTTVSCEVLSAGQRRLTFSPRYGGVDGSPVSFSVANELLPTTAGGPYSLDLYTDNPVITLSGVQGGVESRFSYGWLSACNAGARPGAEPVAGWVARLSGNPVVSGSVVVDITGGEGQSLSLSLVDVSGQVKTHRWVRPSGSMHREVFDVWGQGGGLLLLRVTDGVRIQTLKAVKQ